jgi:hypothetical protein
VRRQAVSSPRVLPIARGDGLLSGVAMLGEQSQELRKPGGAGAVVAAGGRAHRLGGRCG